MTDPGTIAGLVSALAAALLGAVSGYLSYQHRKFCFSVLREYSSAAYGLQKPLGFPAHPPALPNAASVSRSLRLASLSLSPDSRGATDGSEPNRPIPRPWPCTEGSVGSAQSRPLLHFT